MEQSPMYRPAAGPNPGLTRYGSAPGSLLASIADSVISEGGASGYRSLLGSGPGPGPEPPAALPMSRFFTGDALAAESSCSRDPPVGPTGLQRSSSDFHYQHQQHHRHHPAGEISAGANGGVRHHQRAPDEAAGAGGAHLMRHSSSPAGFFSNLLVDGGFSVGRPYSQPSNGGPAMPSTRLKSQMSFSRQEHLSQISEMSIHEMGESVGGGNSHDETAGNVGQSYISSNYSVGSWDDSNSIAFSSPSNKRARDSSDDLLTSISHLDSQFSLPTTSLEMAAVEKLLQAQQDSVAFKVRAKRGCATHPRSIAERERRTRISEKLRKLQELVPNMDKQTSTSDMLDLAVQHIKELQRQIQDLNQERESCTCACKEELA